MEQSTQDPRIAAAAARIRQKATPAGPSPDPGGDVDLSAEGTPATPAADPRIAAAAARIAAKQHPIAPLSSTATADPFETVRGGASVTPPEPAKRTRFGDAMAKAGVQNPVFGPAGVMLAPVARGLTRMAGGAAAGFARLASALPTDLTEGVAPADSRPAPQESTIAPRIRSATDRLAEAMGAPGAGNSATERGLELAGNVAAGAVPFAAGPAAGLAAFGMNAAGAPESNTLTEAGKLAQEHTTPGSRGYDAALVAQEMGKDPVTAAAADLLLNLGMELGTKAALTGGGAIGGKVLDAVHGPVAPASDAIHADLNNRSARTFLEQIKTQGGTLDVPTVEPPPTKPPEIPTSPTARAAQRIRAETAALLSERNAAARAAEAPGGQASLRPLSHSAAIDTGRPAGSTADTPPASVAETVTRSPSSSQEPTSRLTSSAAAARSLSESATGASGVVDTPKVSDPEARRNTLPVTNDENGAPIYDARNDKFDNSAAGQRRRAIRDQWVAAHGEQPALVDKSWTGPASIRTADDLAAAAIPEQHALVQQAHAWTKDLDGVRVVDPGTKPAASLQNKISRKAAAAAQLAEETGQNVAAAQKVGDAARASLVVKSAGDVKRVVDRIRSSGWLVELDDFFAKPTSFGYGAIHMQLRNPETGFMSELQVHTAPTWDARFRHGGHDLYDALDSKADRMTLGTADELARALRNREYSRHVYAEAAEDALAGRPPRHEGRLALRMHYKTGHPQRGQFYVADPHEGHDGAPLFELNTDNPYEARSKMLELEGQHGEAPDYSNTPRPTPAAAPAERLPGAIGREDETSIGAHTVRTRYRAVEADDLVPSNDPHNGFAQRTDFPPQIQGRVYHGEAGRGAAERTVEMAGKLKPTLLSHPSRSVNGPPVVSSAGHVIVGNQRTMAQQLAYRGEHGAPIKAQIVRDAGILGLDADAVARMKAPVLVREITDPAYPADDHELMAKLNQLSDIGTGKAKDPRVEAAGRARQLARNPAILEEFASSIGADQTIADYLRGPQGSELLDKLVKGEVIAPQELDQFRDAATGKLTKQGRDRIAEIVQSAAVSGDVALLDNAPPAIVAKMDQAWPRLVKAADTEGWSLEAPLREALELHTQRVDNNMKSIADVLGQGDMFGGEAAADTQGVQLAKFLERAKKGDVTAALEQYAAAAERAKSAGAADDMFGHAPETPDQAFARVFQEKAPPPPIAEPSTVQSRAKARQAKRRAGEVGGGDGMLGTKMMGSIAGAGIGAAGGARAGDVGDTPAERRRNRILGAAAGALAGAALPWAPAAIGKVFAENPELVSDEGAAIFKLSHQEGRLRLTIAGKPSAGQWAELMDALREGGKSFRFSLRRPDGAPISGGSDPFTLMADLKLGYATARTGAVGTQPNRGATTDLFGDAITPAEEQGGLFGSSAGTEGARSLEQSESSARAEIARLQQKRDILDSSAKGAQLTPAAFKERVRISSRQAELERLVNRGQKLGADELAHRAGGDLFGNRTGAIGVQPTPPKIPQPPTAADEAFERAGKSIDFSGRLTKAAGGSTRTLSSRIQRVMDGLANANGPLERLGELAGSTPHRDPGALLTYVKSSDGTAHEAIAGGGVLDPITRKPVAPSLSQIFEPIRGNDQDLERAITYLKAKRDLGRGSEGLGGDTAALDDAHTIVQFGDQDPTLKKIAQQWEQFTDGIGNYAVKSGLWTPKQWEAMKASDALYVRYKRIMDEGVDAAMGRGAGGRSLANVTSGVKSFKGSARAVSNPIEAMGEYARQIIHRSDRYRVGAAVFDALDDLGPEADLIGSPIRNTSELSKAGGAVLARAQAGAPNNVTEALLDLFTPQISKDNPVIWRNGANGRREYLQLHDASLWGSLMQMNATDGAVRKFLNLTVRPLKRFFTSATTGLVPRFSLVTNPLRDIPIAMAQSQAGLTPADIVKGYAEASASLIGRSDLAKEAQRFGLAHVSIFSQDLPRSASSVAPIGTGARAGVVARRVTGAPIHGLEALGNASDLGPRLGEYMAAVKQNMKKVDAGEWTIEEARLDAARKGRGVTLDFSNQPGNAVLRLFGDYIPFFRVGLQGPTKFAQSAMANPKRVGSVAAAAGGAAAMAWFLKHQLPEEERQKINDLDASTRSGYLYVPTSPGGPVLKIPVAQELNIFVQGMTAALDGLYETDAHAGRLLAETGKRLLPSGLDAMIQGVIPVPGIQQIEENARNQKVFGDRPVEPRRMENLPPASRRLDTTSPTYDAIAAAVRAQGRVTGVGKNASPLQAENVVRGVTSTATPLVTAVTDPIASRIMGRSKKPTIGQGAARNPLSPSSAILASDPPAATESERTYYAIKDKLEQGKAEQSRISKTKDRDAVPTLRDTYGQMLREPNKALVKETDDRLAQLHDRADQVRRRFQAGQLEEAAARTQLDQLTTLRQRLVRRAVSTLRARGVTP